MNALNYTMKYFRISLLTVIVFATSGCDGLPGSVEYFFNSGGSPRQGASISGDSTSGEATLVISSLPIFLPAEFEE